MTTKWLKYHLEESAKAVGCKFVVVRDCDAGIDIYAKEAVTLFSKEQEQISTGLYLEIPLDHWGLLKDRSSLASRGIFVVGGVIDSGYRGEIVVLLRNAGHKHYHVEAGNRIAQLIVIECPKVTIAEVEKNKLLPSSRGSDGFGSTGA